MFINDFEAVPITDYRRKPVPNKFTYKYKYRIWYCKFETFNILDNLIIEEKEYYDFINSNLDINTIITNFSYKDTISELECNYFIYYYLYKDHSDYKKLYYTGNVIKYIIISFLKNGMEKIIVNIYNPIIRENYCRTCIDLIINFLKNEVFIIYILPQTNPLIDFLKKKFMILKSKYINKLYKKYGKNYKQYISIKEKEKILKTIKLNDEFKKKLKNLIIEDKLLKEQLIYNLENLKKDIQHIFSLIIDKRYYSMTITYSRISEIVNAYTHIFFKSKEYYENVFIKNKNKKKRNKK